MIYLIHMNQNKLLFSIILLLIVLFGGIHYFRASNNEGSFSDVTKDKLNVSENIYKETKPTSAYNIGSYEPYSLEKILKAENNKLVLFFHANWCPTCRALDADIKSHLDNIPEHTIILDVDYDSEVSLKQKYKVTIQHTLIQVDKNGEIIKKWLGSPTLKSLISELK